MDAEALSTIETIIEFAAVFVIGLPMLLFGRRLFWLLGGLAMAVIGLVIGALVFGVAYGGDIAFRIDLSEAGEPGVVLSPLMQQNLAVIVPALIVAFGVGAIIGALILIRFPRAASTLVGFVGGIFLLLQLLDLYSVKLGSWLSFPVTAVAGVVVAIIARRNPDTSLIVLSTVIGTIIIVQGLNFYPYASLSAIATLGLMLFGIIFQTNAMHRRQAKLQAQAALAPGEL